jgi:hypothetical protein
MRLSIQVLVVFSGDSWRQTYTDQLIDAFPNVSFHDRLRLEHFKESDHTFSLANDRIRLLGAIIDWLQCFEAAPMRVVVEPMVSASPFRRKLPAMPR